MQAAGHYSEITMQNGDVILHDKHLDKLMQILPNTFVRVHRSYTINLNKLTKYVKGKGGTVVLSNGKEVLVSSTKKANLLSYFK
mgnify:CR=1 FL=1